MAKQERVTLTVPADLERKARAKAILEGKNLSQVVREMLREYAKDAPEPELKAAP